LVFGIIDYGYFFLLDMQCTQAAREGARKGVVQTTIAQAQTTAQAAALSYLASVGLNAGANVPTVALPTTANDGVGGTNLVVTVILSPFRALVGFVPTPPGITITSTMHYEGAVGP
jgi:Flp pilus assembly protein TadG